MPRFTKQVGCTPSESLAALRAGKLSPLARRSAELHLGSCDFCAAELRLLGAAPAEAVVAVPEPPPMPLALRLFAESKLAEALAPARRAA
jgi:hypothetical protein